MKYILPIVLSSVLSIPTIAQPVVKNAEDFKTGTVLKFRVCDTVNVSPGNSGANQAWDFSGLKQKPDTSIEWMVLPATTPFKDKFPGANQVEKYSDGSYVYVDKETDHSSLLGYVNPNMTIAYPKPVLFAKRPISYKSKFSEPFTNSFSNSGMSFSGTGTATVKADGYGELILPGKTYKNVLRIKITQLQIDTIKQYNSTITMTIVTYAWFDGVHTSALFKISYTKSTGYNSKLVEYLLNEDEK